jgi:hypothetical protein
LLVVSEEEETTGGSRACLEVMDGLEVVGRSEGLKKLQMIHVEAFP